MNRLQRAAFAAAALMTSPLLARTCLCLMTGVLVAQQPAESAPATQEPKPPAPGDPVLVTATRDARDPFLVPYSAEVIDSRQLRERGYRNTPQALRDLPGVMVQETSPGQGSPFLRGFTGYSNLFLIDGIRLNHAAFRAGPNQYWNTVDALGLDRIEVVMGPASTLYGSDAIGGTVQAFTRRPDQYARQGLAYGGMTYGRFASAENSIMGRGEFSIGQTWEDGARTGFLIGGSAKSFGDIEGGRGTGLQPETGYRENAVDFKIEHQVSPDERWVFFHHQLAQYDVPRTHSTIAGRSWRGTAVGTDRRRENDQDRSLSYVQYHRERLGGFVDAVRASLSWQQHEETTDRIRSNGAQDVQGFTVGSLGAWVQMDSKATSFGRFQWGIEFYRDHVDSFLRRSTPQPADWIQGPVADNARYDTLGIYLQDSIALGDRAELILGGRFTHVAADADKVRDPVTSTRTSLKDNWSQFTGNARLRYDLLPRHWNVFGGVSQGFRAPSLADLSSFELARSGEFEVPSLGLEPEHYLSYELGTKWRSESWSVRAAWFHTDVDDQIQRFPTGNTNSQGQNEITKANVGRGFIHGVELAAGYQATEELSLFAAGSWQYGRSKNFETAGGALTEEPMSRVMPLMVRLGARYDFWRERCWVESEVVHSAEQDKLSAADRRDTQRIPQGGTPGYTVWNLRCGWQVRDNASLDAAIENLTDYDYRVHGSGSNSLGRNLVLGMTVRF
jgi:hemoglobin/transferrin/lactoferrin receptor protein